MPVEVRAWKAMRKGTLLGFLTVRLGKALLIKDLTLHRHENGRLWVGFPGKPVLDASGTQKINERGKPDYVTILEWLDTESRDRFSEAVVAAVERAHPGATQP